MPDSKKVLIVGAGGFGREVRSWLGHWLVGNAAHKFKGFLDDNQDALSAFPNMRIVGSIREYEPRADEVLVCGLGNPGTKLRVCEALIKKGARFMTIVHPSAIVGERVAVGSGSVLCPGAILTCDIELGGFVTINAAASVGHDVRIGAGSTLSGHADVTGGAVLGKGVFMGSHATVLPGIVVGDFAVVGAGSAVVKAVKAGTTVFGVPAKQVAGF